MENLNYLSKDYGRDFVASVFFRSLGIKGLKFSTIERKVGDAKVRLFHVEGFSEMDGRCVDTDFWPNRCQTAEDIKAIPEEVKDIKIRFGVFTDETTGEIRVAEKPTVIAYSKDGEFVGFNGRKPEWDDAAGKSIWSNEPEKK